MKNRKIKEVKAPCGGPTNVQQLHKNWLNQFNRGRHAEPMNLEWKEVAVDGFGHENVHMVSQEIGDGCRFNIRKVPCYENSNHNEKSEYSDGSGFTYVLSLIRKSGRRNDIVRSPTLENLEVYAATSKYLVDSVYDYETEVEFAEFLIKDTAIRAHCQVDKAYKDIRVLPADWIHRLTDLEMHHIRKAGEFRLVWSSSGCITTGEIWVVSQNLPGNIHFQIQTDYEASQDPDAPSDILYICYNGTREAIARGYRFRDLEIYASYCEHIVINHHKRCEELRKQLMEELKTDWESESKLFKLGWKETDFLKEERDNEERLNKELQKERSAHDREVGANSGACIVKESSGHCYYCDTTPA